MKKTLLMAMAAVALTAGAQTVQNIPTTAPLLINGDYSKIEVNNLPPEGVTREYVSTHEKFDNGETYAFGNFYPGDIAELKLNNTKESCYIIKFVQACKPEWAGAYGVFSLIDKEGNTAWSTTYNPPATAKASYGYSATELYIQDPLEVGEYTFRIEFQNTNGNEYNTFNCAKFEFEARDVVVASSIYAYNEPAEAGAITLSPSQNQYLNGTEVTATASAITGYKFTHFDVDGEVITTNPYTFIVEGSMDITAYYEELIMANALPGWINFETRAGLSKNGRIEAKTGMQVDGEPYNDGESVNMLGNYRNGDSESFELKVTEDGSYVFDLIFSCKRDAAKNETPSLVFAIYDKAAYDEAPADAEAEWTTTVDGINDYNNWSKGVHKEISGVNLTKGSKYLLVKFLEPVSNKYTCNIVRMGFSLNGSFDAAGSGVENVAVKNVKALKAYNVLGVQVAPDAKGLVIFEDGTKVINK